MKTLLWAALCSCALSLACDSKHADCKDCPHAGAADTAGTAAAAPAPDSPRATINLDRAPARGPANAKVTLVVFSDFQCPFCARGAELVRHLESRYSGQLRVAFKHLPLPMHPDARLAAAASIAASEQGRFWEFHDRLFSQQQRGDLSKEGLEKHADAVGLSVSQFQRALQDPQILRAVDADAEEAARLGISGTPTFFINGIKVVGAQSVDVFARIIDRELQG
jgi:protein-disulfide isomerase